MPQQFLSIASSFASHNADCAMPFFQAFLHGLHADLEICPNLVSRTCRPAVRALAANVACVLTVCGLLRIQQWNEARQERNATPRTPNDRRYRSLRGDHESSSSVACITAKVGAGGEDEHERSPVEVGHAAKVGADAGDDELVAASYAGGLSCGGIGSELIALLCDSGCMAAAAAAAALGLSLCECMNDDSARCISSRINGAGSSRNGRSIGNA